MNYLKPKISSKKIKLNFFLTNITPLDRFHLIGDVYAGSGDCGCVAESFACSCTGACGQNPGLGNPFGSCTSSCSGGGSGNSGSGSCNCGG